MSARRKSENFCVSQTSTSGFLSFRCVFSSALSKHAFVRFSLQSLVRVEFLDSSQFPPQESRKGEELWPVQESIKTPLSLARGVESRQVEDNCRNHGEVRGHHRLLDDGDAAAFKARGKERGVRLAIDRELYHGGNGQARKNVALALNSGGRAFENCYVLFFIFSASSSSNWATPSEGELERWKKDVAVVIDPTKSLYSPKSPLLSLHAALLAINIREQIIKALPSPKPPSSTPSLLPSFFTLMHSDADAPFSVTSQAGCHGC